MLTKLRVVNAMTIDVEEYFHANVFDRTPVRESSTRLESRVVSGTERMLDLLAEAEVRASFFVLGLVAERHPDLVRRIAAAGHEIASHGYWHQLVFDQSELAFREDVRRAKEILESITGARVRGYRAPSYSVTRRSLWALDVLVQEGYEYDASIFPIRHDRYGIPQAPRHPFVLDLSGGQLVEAPPSTVKFAGVNLPVAGGGYFRLLPYAWTRWGIGRLNTREERPAIFYTHPWEIDAAQPRLPLSRLSAIRHYRNLGTTEAKLRRLLRDFRFAPLADVIGGLSRRQAHAAPAPDARPTVALGSAL